MLVAGLFHAGWHAIVKTGRSLSLLAGMGLVIASLAFPFLFFVPTPSGEVWPILLLSLFSCMPHTKSVWRWLSVI
jgi:hypothetical protein